MYRAAHNENINFSLSDSDALSSNWVKISVIRKKELNNPYLTPKSSLDLAKEDEVANRSIVVSVLVVLVGAMIGYVILYQIIYPIAVFVNSISGMNSENYTLAVDSILNIVVIGIVFYVISKIHNICYGVIVSTLALIRFIYWGIESKAYIYGINPMYPIWYELISIVDGFIVAVFAIAYNKRTNQLGW